MFCTFLAPAAHLISVFGACGAFFVRISGVCGATFVFLGAYGAFSYVLAPLGGSLLVLVGVQLRWTKKNVAVFSWEELDRVGMTSTWKRWFSLPCFECIRYNLRIFESTQPFHLKTVTIDQLHAHHVWQSPSVSCLFILRWEQLLYSSVCGAWFQMSPTFFHQRRLRRRIFHGRAH